VNAEKGKPKMKSLPISLTRVFELAKSRTFAILIAVVLPTISPFAFADGATWSLDSATSSVRLFQGSAANPDSVNTGVARVTGRVKLDPNDLGNSVFDLSIYPADEQWGEALSAEGTLPVGYVPDATDHTLLTFESKRILRKGDATLEVIGDLTLTRVERSVTLTPNDAYAGPVYGVPVLRTEIREVRFLFPDLNATLASGSLRPVNLTVKRDLDLSGSAHIGHEDFPGLLGAIQATNWPVVVQNERCQMPYTVGEDYHGPTCTGTVIAATSQGNCHMPATVGDDYTGPVCTPPSGDQTTIVLDLKMLRTGADEAAGSASESAATR
jgi:polyisoprenoid-binding protein YceI